MKKHPAAATTDKIFVLDTNVILHDSNCLSGFGEHDVALPITVLEELDQFKRGKEDIHFQAREFLRQLDGLTGSLVSTQGTQRGAGLGNIRVVLCGPFEPELKDAFFSDTPDHRILNVALRLRREESCRSVILVTKDTNLRMKAKSLGLPAEDYTSGKVESFDMLYKGKRLHEDVPGEWIDQFYVGAGVVSMDGLRIDPPAVPNENFIFRNGSRSVLATYRSEGQFFQRVERGLAYGIHPRNAEQSFALAALLNREISLVTLLGKAGTGKTLLALAAALEMRSNYRQIMLARPVVPLSNRDLGFLPGDVSAKLDPYMQPLYDNLTVIRHQFPDHDAAAQRIADMLQSDRSPSVYSWAQLAADVYDHRRSPKPDTP